MSLGSTAVCHLLVFFLSYLSLFKKVTKAANQPKSASGSLGSGQQSWSRGLQLRDQNSICETKVFRNVKRHHHHRGVVADLASGGLRRSSAAGGHRGPMGHCRGGVRRAECRLGTRPLHSHNTFTISTLYVIHIMVSIKYMFTYVIHLRSV